MSIRLRLTAAFALSMALVLVGAAAFVYLRLHEDLDESVTAGLTARAGAVAAAGAASAGASSEEGFAQVVAVDGRVVDAAGGPRESVLTAVERATVARGGQLAERRVPGIEGVTRVLARAGPRSQLVVVGQSLDDRDETLGNLVGSFALGGPIAVLLAAALGYALAATGLRPVELMRRRAQEVSLSDPDDRLPLPTADDEIRRLGETLNEMLARLRRSFERERRFVADASHELRTPVAVIKTEVEGALRAPPGDPGVRDALVACLEECEHLARLGEDLLVVAQAGEGQLPLHLTDVDLGELLERVRRRFGDRATGHDRRIETRGGGTVRADELRLAQLVGNLVDNALRHGAGTVTVTARAADTGAELVVTDEGDGFGVDLAGRAFERFTRGDAARTRGGTGLGLAIVQAITQAHGGSAAIDGSTVRVRLGRLSCPAA